MSTMYSENTSFKTDTGTIPVLLAIFGLHSLKWEGAKRVPLMSFKRLCLSIITQLLVETVFLMNKIRPLSLRIVSNSRRTVKGKVHFHFV